MININKCPICKSFPTWHRKKKDPSLTILCCPNCLFGNFEDDDELIEHDKHEQICNNIIAYGTRSNLYITNWNNKTNDSWLILKKLLQREN